METKQVHSSESFASAQRAILGGIFRPHEYERKTIRQIHKEQCMIPCSGHLKCRCKKRSSEGKVCCERNCSCRKNKSPCSSGCGCSGSCSYMTQNEFLSCQPTG